MAEPVEQGRQVQRLLWGVGEERRRRLAQHVTGGGSTLDRAASAGATPVADLSCPSCRSERFRVFHDGELTIFRCAGCGCCLHVELGYVHRVHPPAIALDAEAASGQAMARGEGN